MYGAEQALEPLQGASAKTTPISLISENLKWVKPMSVDTENTKSAQSNLTQNDVLKSYEAPALVELDVDAT
jgi:hypothetical protein